MKLSYSVNSIKTGSLLESSLEVMKSGYSGVELCFSKDQCNPFYLTDDEVLELRKQFAEKKINPVAISTATTFFLSDIPHEPSVVSVDVDSRQSRINNSRFKLHFDLSHTYCTEKKYLQTIKEASKDTAYIHLSDIKIDYNLTFLDIKDEQSIPSSIST
ncbi:hypothetical protein [Shewanella surugensis]|uniref:Xylose isomerase-like TIM barrel domain-containing protein n=1 Tax=Shewanella surugensis TaxID=212020 RepID=A0ABT0LB16_9GAMM|nr:hypothetical protein [Shewanella surugensis]MCL1124893.1 hypothetical protein [Shewanella surugensis]